MNKKVLLVCTFCMALMMTAFGQQSTSKTHTPPQVVLTTPNLKAQADKIQAKESQLSQAATSSRAHFAQLQEELSTLNKEYKILLTNEIALSTNEASRAELRTELNYVEQQLAPVTHQR